jgi:hypothetical protein
VAAVVVTRAGRLTWGTLPVRVAALAGTAAMAALGPPTPTWLQQVLVVLVEVAWTRRLLVVVVAV